MFKSKMYNFGVFSSSSSSSCSHRFTSFIYCLLLAISFTSLLHVYVGWWWRVWVSFFFLHLHTILPVTFNAFVINLYAGSNGDDYFFFRRWFIRYHPWLCLIYCSCIAILDEYQHNHSSMKYKLCVGCVVMIWLLFVIRFIFFFCSRCLSQWFSMCFSRSYSRHFDLYHFSTLPKSTNNEQK